MNMFKKNGGFTLVELIVVIAILAILAGVAVPAYSGYIAKAQQAADLQTLSAVNTAVQGVAIGKDVVVDSITVAAAGTVTGYDASGTAVVSNDEVVALTGPLSFGNSFNGATWGKVNGVAQWTLTPAK